MTAHPIPELDSAGLRRFALSTGAIVIVLFGLLFPWLLGFSIPRWPWVLAGILIVWGMVAPASLRGVYRGWMRFGLLANRVVTPIVLGLVYFLMITPIALYMKLISRDTMSRTFDATAESYRVPSRRQPPHKMEKPF